MVFVHLRINYQNNIAIMRERERENLSFFKKFFSFQLFN